MCNVLGRIAVFFLFSASTVAAIRQGGLGSSHVQQARHRATTISQAKANPFSSWFSSSGSGNTPSGDSSPVVPVALASEAPTSQMYTTSDGSASEVLATAFDANTGTGMSSSSAVWDSDNAFQQATVSLPTGDSAAAAVEKEVYKSFEAESHAPVVPNLAGLPGSANASSGNASESRSLASVNSNETTKDLHESSHLGTTDGVRKKSESKTDHGAADATVSSSEHVEGIDQPVVAPGRTCTIGESEDCRSMCRWMKMTDKEINGRCPLLEWQLKACEYTSPEDRPANSNPHPLDCAVNMMRLDVLEKDVLNYVESLEACISDVPDNVNETCHVGLGLLHSEIHDWKNEAGLHDQADKMRDRLLEVTKEGKVALRNKKDEEAAIEDLSDILGEAEEIKGHYLVKEIHAARAVLDKLGPIPAVRVQLEASKSEGEIALADKSLNEVKEAIVWLNASIIKGKKLHLGHELSDDIKLLSELDYMKSALIDLRQAVFEGNVSYGTRFGMRPAINTLEQAIHRANKDDLPGALPAANELLAKLVELDTAVNNTLEAVSFGTSILELDGNKGKEQLARGIDLLNTTVTQAQKLGLADHDSTSRAVAELDRLLYIFNARLAMQRSLDHAQEILLNNRGELSDDREEVAIDILGPAIEWGKEVGLHNGLPVSTEALETLHKVEGAKEVILQALVQGNSSLEAGSREPEAISALESAIKGCQEANVSGGVAAAQKMLEALRARMGARNALEKATATAGDAWRSRSGLEDALNAMNVSIDAAEKVGLKKQASIARDQVSALEQFVVIDGVVSEEMKKHAPSPPLPQPAEIEDTRPGTVFNKTGLRVVEQPAVPNGADDRDDNFDEHIDALAQAIAAGKRQGVIDPVQQAMLSQAFARKNAYKLLQSAIQIGEAAWNTKSNVIKATTKLSIAIHESEEMEIELELSQAKELYSKIEQIQPAIDELEASILSANVSIHTVSGMDKSINGLNRAIDLNRKLDLLSKIPTAEHLRDQLMQVKKTYVALRAAILQGEISLQTEQGEEASIAELHHAIEMADAINLKKRLPVAIDLLHELNHMNAEHQQLQAAMDPRVS